jgi:hypothetical protein
MYCTVLLPRHTVPLQLEREQRGLRRELDLLKEQSERCADQAKGYAAQLTELQAKASKHASSGGMLPAAAC